MDGLVVLPSDRGLVCGVADGFGVPFCWREAVGRVSAVGGSGLFRCFGGEGWLWVGVFDLICGVHWGLFAERAVGVNVEP